MIRSPILRSRPLWTASAARWIARLAHEYGLGLVGENPGHGYEENAYYEDLSATGMLETALRQVRGCQFDTLYWAHSGQLWNGTIPFQEFAKRIR